MMNSISRYLVVTILIGGFVCALCLGVAQSSAHAQTTASVLKAPAAVKFEPAPKVLTGTLFNTVEQRQRLDRALQRGGVLEDEVVASDAGEPERSVINGFVKRSDGRNTVWVDDVMKRDPRSEVMEQVEPNVVGGATRGLSKAALTNSKTKASFASPNSPIKNRATRKTNRGSKPFLPRRPIKK
jgi:hypothetical protein